MHRKRALGCVFVQRCDDERFAVANVPVECAMRVLRTRLAREEEDVVGAAAERVRLHHRELARAPEELADVAAVRAVEVLNVYDRNRTAALETDDAEFALVGGAHELVEGGGGLVQADLQLRSFECPLFELLEAALRYLLCELCDDCAGRSAVGAAEEREIL